MKHEFRNFKTYRSHRGSKQTKSSKESHFHRTQASAYFMAFLRIKFTTVLQTPDLPFLL